MREYIAVFDSGVGGLTVLKHLKEMMPKENYIFLADTLNMPYGDKDKEEIQELCLHNYEFLKEFNIKAVVIACNTADSLAGDYLKTISDKNYEDPAFLARPCLWGCRLAHVSSCLPLRAMPDDGRFLIGSCVFINARIFIMSV